MCLHSVEACLRSEEHTGDALAFSADEGRGTLRKAPIRRVQPLTVGDVRMGKPSMSYVMLRESEGTGGSETSEYPEEEKTFRE